MAKAVYASSPYGASPGTRPYAWMEDEIVPAVVKGNELANAPGWFGPSLVKSAITFFATTVTTGNPVAGAIAAATTFASGAAEEIQPGSGAIVQEAGDYLASKQLLKKDEKWGGVVAGSAPDPPAASIPPVEPPTGSSVGKMQSGMEPTAVAPKVASPSDKTGYYTMLGSADTFDPEDEAARRLRARRYA